MARYELRDADIVAISLVKEGANRKRFYLKKSATLADRFDLDATSRIVKTADWSTVYCVVAEPGAPEGQGVGDTTGEGDEDIWTEDEIRKAAHRFMRNGALINHMHETLEPYGEVVENFIAPANLAVNGEVIKAGSWCIGICPTEHGRDLIEKGELGGVSIQGNALRHLVEKMAHERTIGSKGNGLFGMKGKQLPAYMQHVYNDLVEGGAPTGSATYRKAIGIVKNWKDGHDGKGGKVSAATQAKAAKAWAEWEKLKAEAKADNVKKGSRMHRFLEKLAKAAGLEDELEEIVKSELTFAQLLGRRELSDELPTAMDTLREAIYNAFYPYTPDGSNPDPAEIRASLATSLEEFGEHMLGMYDGLATGSIKKSAEEIAAEVATLRPIDQSPQEDTVDATEIANVVKSSIAEGLKPLDDRIKSVEDTVADLKKSADEAKEPTLAELKEQQAELAKGQEKVAAALKKLAAGDSSVTGDDPEDESGAEAFISKAQKQDPAFSGALLI